MEQCGVRRINLAADSELLKSCLNGRNNYIGTYERPVKSLPFIMPWRVERVMVLILQLRMIYYVYLIP
jgi:hypothetical protein